LVGAEGSLFDFPVEESAYHLGEALNMPLDT
jgi:hypothetical protein